MRTCNDLVYGEGQGAPFVKTGWQSNLRKRKENFHGKQNVKIEDGGSLK
jgi:hypothetical protein